MALQGSAASPLSLCPVLGMSPTSALSLCPVLGKGKGSRYVSHQLAVPLRWSRGSVRFNNTETRNHHSLVRQHLQASPNRCLTSDVTTKETLLSFDLVFFMAWAVGQVVPTASSHYRAVGQVVPTVSSHYRAVGQVVPTVSSHYRAWRQCLSMKTGQAFI